MRYRTGFGTRSNGKSILEPAPRLCDNEPHHTDNRRLAEMTCAECAMQRADRQRERWEATDTNGIETQPFAIDDFGNCCQQRPTYRT